MGVPLAVCMCHVLVERCWGHLQTQGLQTQGELN